MLRGIDEPRIMYTIYVRRATLITFILLCSLPVQTRGDVAIPDCSAQVVELAPCLSYVSNQEPSPTQSCCDALQTVVMKTPICLCELVGRGKNGTMNTGLPPLNYTLVRELPKDCGVQSEVHKDETLCQVHGAPAPAPYSYEPAGSTGSPLLLSPVLLLLAWSVIATCGALFRPSAVLSPTVILKAQEVRVTECDLHGRDIFW